MPGVKEHYLIVMKFKSKEEVDKTHTVIKKIKAKNISCKRSTLRNHGKKDTKASKA